MKYPLPSFLEGIETPIEGEIALRKFANSEFIRNLPPVLGEVGESEILVAGVDEVGRGPLAGPVVACVAVLKSPDILPSLNDSKKLTRPKREAMYEAVKEACVCYAIASASAQEIDQLNILEADFLAMRRALQALGFPGINETAPEIPVEVKGAFFPGFSQAQVLIAVDGNLKIRQVPEQAQLAIVKGDGRVASISAASILAKVFRDRYMDGLELKYPGYGFNKHAGYGTKAHLEAIRKLGLTPEHRKSFHPKGL